MDLTISLMKEINELGNERLKILKIWDTVWLRNSGQHVKTSETSNSWHLISESFTENANYVIKFRLTEMRVRDGKEVGHSNDTVLFDLLIDISFFEFKVNSFVQSFCLIWELSIKFLIQIFQLNHEFSGDS